MLEYGLSDVQNDIVIECNNIKELLLEKNRKYGNSAIHPSRIFSKSSSIEQIYVRIDDKINRIMNRQDDDVEDTITDLIGYLILLRVALKQDSKILSKTKTGL